MASGAAKAALACVAKLYWRIVRDYKKLQCEFGLAYFKWGSRSRKLTTPAALAGYFNRHLLINFWRLINEASMTQSGALSGLAPLFDRVILEPL